MSEKLLIEIYNLFEEMTGENFSYFITAIEIDWNGDGEEIEKKIIKLKKEIKNVLQIK